MKRLNKLWLLAYDVGVNDESFKKFLVEFEKMNPLLVLKLDFRL